MLHDCDVSSILHSSQLHRFAFAVSAVRLASPVWLWCVASSKQLPVETTTSDVTVSDLPTSRVSVAALAVPLSRSFQTIAEHLLEHGDCSHRPRFRAPNHFRSSDCGSCVRCERVGGECTRRRGHLSGGMNLSKYTLHCILSTHSGGVNGTLSGET